MTKITYIVPSLEERHGGPSKSVRALATSVAQAGSDVELLATTEAGDAPAPARGPANIQLFPRVTPRWLVRSPDLRAHLRATPTDVVHHHSVWLLTLRYAVEAAKKHGAPLVISPRGMLSGWAYRHHRWRKRLAELFVHPGAFAAAAAWHITSAGELEDIRALGFTQPAILSPNGVTLPTDAELTAARAAWHDICPATKQRPVALFYSRFHRKKRLRELVDLWLSAPRGDWLLLIAGLPEDYSLAEVDGWIAAAGAQEKVVAYDSTGRPPPYAIASLFVLPSHSENFGLVIAEAIAARVPALVTDTTPWQLLGPAMCGWCVHWEKYGEVLAAALATPPDVLRAMGESGRALADRDYSWKREAQVLTNFYQELRDARR